jgi:type IV pilus assembly protein PilB
MRAGIITEKQLNDALEVYRATGSPIGRVLVDLGYASQGAILSVMARQIGIEYIDFAERRPDPAAVALVSRDLASRYILMPIEVQDNVLVVAMADPQNVLALDDLRIITGHEIKPAISTKDDILAAIDEYYKVAEHEDTDLLTGTDEFGGDQELDQITDVVEEAPAVKLVNYIIQKAVADRASDIHIEPQEGDLRVRFRIDGVLHEAMPPAPKSIQTSIISRFKIMAEMDIAESRKPQDGHCAINIAGHKLDFRVSTLPTVYGERIVLRLLRTDSILLQLTDLGFCEPTRFCCS